VADPTPRLLWGKRYSFVVRDLAVCIEIGHSMPNEPPAGFVLLDHIHTWPPNAPVVSVDDFLSLPAQTADVVMERAAAADPAILAEHSERTRSKDKGVRP
jgi:hypothetical protein